MPSGDDLNKVVSGSGRLQLRIICTVLEIKAQALLPEASQVSSRVNILNMSLNVQIYFKCEGAVYLRGDQQCCCCSGDRNNINPCCYELGWASTMHSVCI